MANVIIIIVIVITNVAPRELQLLLTYNSL